MEGFFCGENMKIEFIDQNIISEVTASFAQGGMLIKSGLLWSYERDGKSCTAREPEYAVIGAEGLLRGQEIWNSIDKGGE